MIELIGTIHTEIGKNPEDLARLLFDRDYDQLFVEGMSTERMDQEREESRDELYDVVQEELNFGLSRDEFDIELSELDTGPEPGYLEEEWLEPDNKENIVFLDNRRSFDHLRVSLINELKPLSDISVSTNTLKPSSLSTQLRAGNDSREDYLKFLRYQVNEDAADVNYGAIETSVNFKNAKEEIADRCFRSYEEEFLAGFERHDINRFDIQEIIEEGRENFQDGRDEVWYEQIAEYLDENPEDDILVVGGISHMVSGSNTLRGILEEEYEVEITPFYRMR